MSDPPAETLSWVHAALGRGARVLGVEAMDPASHTNHRLAVETPAGTRAELLLRRFTNGERLASDPWYEPAAEVRALRALEATDLPVPELLAEDAEGSACDVPTLLLTWLQGSSPEGTPDMAAFVRELAAPLPTIHAVEPPPSMRAYEPYFASDGVSVESLRPPAWAVDPSVWERAFAVVAADAPESSTRFIHRDYYHGNTVWLGGRLTGIVDWTTGSSGPPGIDLAQARINLAWDYGLEAAEAFLLAWRALDADSGAEHPYWDLLDAVDWLGDGTADPDDDLEALRRYESFVARALADLA